MMVAAGRRGEMVYHNHPSGGGFSDADLSTALTAQRVSCEWKKW